ncbi:hypothetical protein I6F26_10425 [Ensifer sp. IC3342]|nr:hypothetical protein [Ensifer sp. BRP08]MCA1446994.1 hypothetical protein [Ensifer sp. IC3342]
MMTDMQIHRLHAILVDCTRQYRLHEKIVERDVNGIHVVTHEPMPRASEAPPEHTVVDCTLLKVGVHREKAEAHRAELRRLIQPMEPILNLGPSFITLGAEIGDQGAAFQLMALGQVLGFWRIVRPEDLGFTGAKAEQAAGLGYVMLAGYQREEVS